MQTKFLQNGHKINMRRDPSHSLQMATHCIWGTHSNLHWGLHLICSECPGYATYAFSFYNNLLFAYHHSYIIEKDTIFYRFDIYRKSVLCPEMCA